MAERRRLYKGEIDWLGEALGEFGLSRETLASGMAEPEAVERWLEAKRRARAEFLAAVYGTKGPRDDFHSPEGGRGGPGSGHWGHEGRPGERGGSLPGDRKAEPGRRIRGISGHKGRPGKVGGALGGSRGSAGEATGQPRQPESPLPPSRPGRRMLGLTTQKGGARSYARLTADLRRLAARLRELPGVRNVFYDMGVGLWQGETEDTFVVAYDGNGGALRLVAETAKAANQDAALVFEQVEGDEGDLAVDIAVRAGHRLGDDDMRAVARYAQEVGVPGFTWYARGKTASLTAVSIAAWGGDEERHAEAMRQLADRLARAGYSAALTERRVRTTIMEREGENAYERYLGH